VKIKPHHTIKGREEGGDMQVVQELADGGALNYYVLLKAKMMRTASQASRRMCAAGARRCYCPKPS